jgi:hypothetical protein
LPLTNTELQDDLLALIDRITRGPGTTPSGERQDAARGHFEGDLASYLKKVQNRPTEITDHEVAELRAIGHTDDEIFEMTIATALGAAKARLDAGLDAVSAAFDED